MSTRRKCKFSEELQKEFSMFKRSKNDHEVICNTCHALVSVANKGKFDLRQHLESQKHKKFVQGAESSQNIKEIFVKKCKNLDNYAAEAALVFHTINHHISFKTSDCISKFNKKIFKDSETASKIELGRTKIEAIVNKVLGPFSVNYAIETILKENISCIGVCADSSNHGSVKMFPIVIQYFDCTKGVVNKLISLKSLRDEKSQTVANHIIQELQETALHNKVIITSLAGDNCNTNFGGIHRNGKNNLFYHLKTNLNLNLIGIGCPAHILNNSFHFAIDHLPVDIESIINKIFAYFKIYTVRTEKLKGLCEFAEMEYKTLLSFVKTRWLSIFPAINRILELYEPLVEFFKSESKPPYLISKFLDDPLNESYLWFLHSLSFLFETKIKEIENENNSIFDVLSILTAFKQALQVRCREKFLPLKVKAIFKAHADRQNDVIFIQQNLLQVYDDCIQYLDSWLIHLQEFQQFMWIGIKEVPPYESIENTISYLGAKNVLINENKIIDQYENLKTFLNLNLNLEEFSKKLTHEKWLLFFRNKKEEEISEFVKICMYFFSIPAHNANVERIFSLIKAQWTDERNRLSLTTVGNIVSIKYNFKAIDCDVFYDFIRDKTEILKQIGNSAKYQ